LCDVLSKPQHCPTKPQRCPSKPQRCPSKPQRCPPKPQRCPPKPQRCPSKPQPKHQHCPTAKLTSQRNSMNGREPSRESQHSHTGTAHHPNVCACYRLGEFGVCVQ
uniref:IGFBP N-terminal domain-containing protein n=1 Tax=Pygocentrus nattereri TaxID=42514 RepID=A0AAR2L2R6_PYGNA